MVNSRWRSGMPSSVGSIRITRANINTVADKENQRGCVAATPGIRARRRQASNASRRALNMPIGTTTSTTSNCQTSMRFTLPSRKGA